MKIWKQKLFRVVMNKNRWKMSMWKKMKTSWGAENHELFMAIKVENFKQALEFSVRWLIKTFSVY
jgi:hypothetical protein